MEHNELPIQLFDQASSTYTYILVDPASDEALIIDPVDDQMTRDLSLLKEHGLKLRYIVETHAHADHITSAAALIEHTGALAATPEGCGVKPSAVQLRDGDILQFGAQQLKALNTPGHTAGSMSLLWGAHVFTGDTLSLMAVDGLIFNRAALKCSTTVFQKFCLHCLTAPLCGRVMTTKANSVAVLVLRRRATCGSPTTENFAVSNLLYSL